VFAQERSEALLLLVAQRPAEAPSSRAQRSRGAARAERGNAWPKERRVRLLPSGAGGA
jgi:hypothetical protein